jgi:OOP family OmpA-OmpF porin
MMACSSEPKITELDDKSDPQVELQIVNQQLDVALEEQMDVLAPQAYDSAVEARDSAVKARASNKSQKEVLQEIALSSHFLKQGKSTALIAEQILPEAIQARKNAIQAKAKTLYPQDLKKIDSQLLNTTRRMEKNDTAVSVDTNKAFSEAYLSLEQKAAIEDKLGEPIKLQQQAIKEGAKSLAPSTLADNQKLMDQSRKTILSNLKDRQALDSTSRQALSSSERLLKITRTAKSSTAMNPEDYALQAEQNLTAKNLAEDRINSTDESLRKANTLNANMNSTNMGLKNELLEDEKYQSVKKQFTVEEAEVYKEGKTIIIRLKSMAFKSNGATLVDSSYPMMTKIQNAISEINPSKIVIEGHTDSMGPKQLNETLSLNRAKAVQSYLIANDLSLKELVSVKGLNYSRPIASNKSAAGREQNRRVDILLSPSL